MCGLNNRVTKIKIGGSKVQFYLQKNEVFIGNHSDVDTCHWHVALTHDSQRLRLTVNVQIGLPEPIL